MINVNKEEIEQARTFLKTQGDYEHFLGLIGARSDQEFNEILEKKSSKDFGMLLMKLALVVPLQPQISKRILFQALRNRWRKLSRSWGFIILIIAFIGLGIYAYPAILIEPTSMAQNLLGEILGIGATYLIVDRVIRAREEEKWGGVQRNIIGLLYSHLNQIIEKAKGAEGETQKREVLIGIREFSPILESSLMLSLSQPDWVTPSSVRSRALMLHQMLVLFKSYADLSGLSDVITELAFGSLDSQFRRVRSAIEESLPHIVNYMNNPLADFAAIAALFSNMATESDEPSEDNE
jgi:hypothetical protein